MRGGIGETRRAHGTPGRCSAVPSRTYTAAHPHRGDRETSVSHWFEVKKRSRFPPRSGGSTARPAAPRRPGQRGPRRGRRPPRGSAAAAALPEEGPLLPRGWRASSPRFGLPVRRARPGGGPPAPLPPARGGSRHAERRAPPSAAAAGPPRSGLSPGVGLAAWN